VNLLHVAAALDGSEESFQIGVGKQLRQPALFASPAQAQLLAGLLRDIEEIVVPQPGLARDPHELSHDCGFRLFIWRYEVTPLCDPFGFHSCISRVHSTSPFGDCAKSYSHPRFACHVK
jgi:hypothetical protein